MLAADGRLGSSLRSRFFDRPQQKPAFDLCRKIGGTSVSCTVLEAHRWRVHSRHATRL